MNITTIYNTGRMNSELLLELFDHIRGGRKKMIHDSRGRRTEKREDRERMNVNQFKDLQPF